LLAGLGILEGNRLWLTSIGLKPVREPLMRNKGSASPWEPGNLSSCQKTCLAPNRIKFNYNSGAGQTGAERANPADEELSQFFPASPLLKWKSTPPSETLFSRQDAAHMAGAMRKCVKTFLIH